MSAVSPRRDEVDERSKMRTWILSIAAALALLSGPLSTATASSINYGDYISLVPDEPDFLQVREDSITDPTPLFGAPIRVGGKLVFAPLSFASYAFGGSADTTSGTLTMHVLADVGTFLTDIVIKETGDYTLLGVGTPATSATVNGLVVAADVNPGTHIPIVTTLSVTPPGPYKLPVDSFGTFTATTFIDLTGMGVTEIILSLNNNLQTTSQAGTTAFIQKKIIEIMAPEPSSLALLVIGTLFARRRQRAH